MTRAFSLARAAPVTAMSGLGIVFTYLLALPIFGGQPDAWQVAGSLMVIAATLLLTVKRPPALP
jgi:drug/metabolite transporter (DMT)-like permease